VGPCRNDADQDEDKNDDENSAHDGNLSRRDDRAKLRRKQFHWQLKVPVLYFDRISADLLPSNGGEIAAFRRWPAVFIEAGNSF
jgi:hypothetical protein